MNKVALGLCVALSLGGCSAMDYKTGTRITDSTYNGFQNSKTTLKDVRSELGEPQKVRSENGNTVYVYNHDVIKAFPGQKNTSETVVLTFNRKGTLVDKERRKNAAMTSNPLTGR